MTQLLDDPIVALAAVLLLLLILALVWAGSRRPYVREIERLKEDLHRLLAVGPSAGRIAVNGRASAFVDISASMNRLLDRADEALAAASALPRRSRKARRCSTRSPRRCRKSR